jgi:AmmeMemoRadiSam system protein B
MKSLREPVVAGSFYPSDPAVLQSQVDELLAGAGTANPPPKAMVVPHAGYIYSGPVAASGYACLARAAGQIERVVLLGPSHRKAFSGLALPNATVFKTPLGEIELDQAAISHLRSLPQVHIDNEAHRFEHSLEVQLPFLQRILGGFTLVPLVVGDTSAEQVSAVIAELWGGRETLLVISSDLSHYLDYDSARTRDAATTRAIEALDYEHIGYHDACGRDPLNGLLHYARSHDLAIKTIDLRNSGDTAGPRDQVVGYGTWLLWEQ